MKVLMLGWEFPPRISGGLGTACRGITAGLAERGIEVLFVVPRAERSVESGTAGVELYGSDRVPLVSDAAWRRSASCSLLEASGDLRPYGEYGFFAEGLRDPAAELLRYARAVGELARVRRFDLVHAHDWMTFAAGIHARELSGKPLVCHVHSLEEDRAGASADPRILELERAGLRAADLVLCVSERTAHAVRERCGIPAARVAVVHNAVPRIEVGPPVEDDPDRPPLVLFAGRITQQKGPRTFLAAAARVLQARADVEFVVAGDGDLLPQVVLETAERGLARKVHFTGFLEAEDLRRLYRRASVFCMPSRSEPFGIVSLEALAHGVPVIVPSDAGVVEAVPSALTFRAGDDLELAEKILALLLRPALRRQVLEEGGRELRDATWDRRGEELEAHYASLLGARP